MAEIARFLNLDDKPVHHGGGSSHNKNHSKGKAAAKLKNRRATPKESERKKLKREMDKLHKAHAKAAKLLEAHKNDTSTVNIPIIDNSLLNDDSNAARAHRMGKIVPPSDIDSFPGIPTHCIPDMLMVWDFLCTFSRTLKLHPIELDDFAAALSFRPQENVADSHASSSDESANSSSSSNMPVYLSESHLALLNLLVGDVTSDTWWWSVLETPEMIEEEDNEYLNAVDRKRKTAAAVVKIDMEGLLNAEEDPGVTTKWLQALDDIRVKKPDNSGAIKNIVKSAIAITTNHLVKVYLKKAMRKWRAKSAGLVKRAVVWLIDKVREARPDLWGRSISDEDLADQKKFVVADANLEMDRVDEDANDDPAGDDNLEGSDDESESDDEEESDNEDEYADHVEPAGTPSKQACSAVPKANDDITPVTTFVPNKPVPSLVDLLLPPAKPNDNDIIHPLTWPPVVGAASLRILQWYKRRRNEVDDGIRNFRQLRPMSVAERRRRESCAPLRILSECGHQSKSESQDVEKAIQHLCEGNDYLTLTAVQRLCILRLLMEAAYDTHELQTHIEDNFKSRTNAVKALEAEERRAKKESREELAAIQTAARERMTREAREIFIEKKRQEVMDCIGGTDLTEEDVENMEDDELIEFDEETKAEYESLPTAESFNKVEVDAMVRNIQEETAFGTDVLSVIKIDDLMEKDAQYLKSLEDELESLNDTKPQRSSASNREITGRRDRLRKEITNFTENKQALAEDREIAIDLLRDAIEDGTIKTLRAAIKTAKLARLTDDDLETGGIWALDVLRDAALELKNAESRKRVVEAKKDLIAKRNKCFIRTDPLGEDRYHSSFIHFDYDESNRIWAERDLVLVKDNSETNEESAVLLADPKSASICAPDEENDFLSRDDRGTPYEEAFLSFARKEYHPSAELSSLSMHHWSCYTTDRSLRALVKNLTSASPQEKELKEALKATLETMALAAGEKNSQGDDATAEKKESIEFLTSGDEAAFDKAKQAIMEVDLNLLENVSSAIKRRVRLRRIPDPDRAPDFAQYMMGSITGWKKDDAQEGVEAIIWKLALDDGGELHISSTEVAAGIIRAIKWSTQHPGYIEHDAPFLSYRNDFGRFCGRAVEAPSSMTPLAFAKHMIKKEQDLYINFKNRAIENNWGGKSGARNAWVSSLKEHGHNFKAVRDGLLTLEEALFELSGGFGKSKPTSEALLDSLANGKSENDAAATNGESSLANGTTALSADSALLKGKDLYYDETSRFDIELESLGNDIHGLWNSSDAREIYREIISTANSVCVLALGLALISRNGQAYINRTKSSVVATATATGDSSNNFVGRRRAAMQRPGAYSDFF
eukprot:scaffold114268_cov37-Cyclotella_meneghiniana.AAC.7